MLSQTTSPFRQTTAAYGYSPKSTAWIARAMQRSIMARSKSAAVCVRGNIRRLNRSASQRWVRPRGVKSGGRLSARRAVGGGLAFRAFKLAASPAPQRLDFLRRLAAAGVFGDAEARSDRILEIDARRQHRLGEHAEAREVACGFAGARATIGRGTLIEHECRLALGQKDGAEGRRRRVDIQAGGTRREQAEIGGLGDEAHRRAVGA